MENTIESFRALLDGMDDEELVQTLESMMKNHNEREVFILIKDHIPNMRIQLLRKNIPLYQRFQIVKQESQASWDYDNKSAKMYDVNVACTKVYGILLRMIKATNDDAKQQFNQMKSALNKIEEHLGIEITKWESDEPNANEQGNT